jgi:DNA/RNA-binding domain of Phe-tRNA-synthetase-like protein
MISVENEIPELALGVASVPNIQKRQATSDFDQWVNEQLALATNEVAQSHWEERRNEVRALLRTGGFKPSGRSKPAQEYLLRCLSEPPFPRVNMPVDCLNVFSVLYGLPISLLRASEFPTRLVLRFGAEGETYVFNNAGQTLDLRGLICACGGTSGQEPLGTPVKDSMKGKIDESTQEAIVVIYGPKKLISQESVATMASELSELIQRWCS